MLTAFSKIGQIITYKFSHLIVILQIENML